MSLKEVVKKVYNWLLVNNEGYLRSEGVSIGQDMTFHCPNGKHVNISDPHLLAISDHVSLTGSITILTQD